MKLREICNYLEELAPPVLQESYDNSGLQVGDPGMEVSGILVVLDVSEGVLLEAERLGFNLVLSHHPVIFGGLKTITGKNASERMVRLAIRKEIAIYSGHTNFDAITGGVNTTLANRLGLINQRILQPLHSEHPQELLRPFRHLLFPTVEPSRAQDPVEHVVRCVRVIRDADVVQDRQIAKDTNALKGTANALLGDLVGGHIGDLLPLEGDGARADRIDAGDHVENRGLASAVGADEPDQFPFLDLDVEIVDRAQTAKELGLAVNLENRRVIAGIWVMNI